MVPDPALDPASIGAASEALVTLAGACEALVPAKRWLQHRSVVAVSGGADSVALFRTLTHIVSCSTPPASERLIIGHIDHAVRGETADADRKFVKKLAREFGARFVSMKLDLETLLGEQDRASEQRLRDARYRCLKQIAEDNGARYLFTGHHLNDQAETILFRIFRGTGLAGLKGIPAIRQEGWLTIVRPLLRVPKALILEALNALNQPYRTDETNGLNDYSRNFIRNEVLKPAVEYFGLPVEESIARLAEHAESALELEAQQVDAYLQDHVPQRWPDELKIQTGPLAAQPNALIRAVLIRLWGEQGWPVSQMTYARWQTLAEMVVTAGQDPNRVWAQNLPGDVHLRIDHRTTLLTLGKRSV